MTQPASPPVVQRRPKARPTEFYVREDAALQTAGRVLLAQLGGKPVTSARDVERALPAYSRGDAVRLYELLRYADPTLLEIWLGGGGEISFRALMRIAVADSPGDYPAQRELARRISPRVRAALERAEKRP